MHNSWLVARHEFLTNIRKKSFLFAVFGIPVMMAVILGISILAEFGAEDLGINVQNLGYVDQSGLLIASVVPPDGWIAYPDAEAAQEAISNSTIDAYFVLPQNYLITGTVEIYSHGKTPDALQDDIAAFLLENLIEPLDTAMSSERLHEPVNLVLFLENNQRELTEDGIVGLLLVPMLFAVVLLVALQLSAGFLMAGIAEEKGNHIMEILISSITPDELLTGKLLGLGVLGLLQVIVWIIVTVVLLALGGDNRFLAGVEMPFDVVMLAIIYFVLTYFMYASVLAGIGAIIGSEQESRQYAGLLTFPLAIPFMFFALFITQPESPVLVVMTLIPVTSAMTVMMRLPFTVIPLWQIILSLLLLTLMTGLIVWLSARVFRWSLLLYGKGFGIRTLWKVVRGTAETGVVPLGGKETIV